MERTIEWLSQQLQHRHDPAGVYQRSARLARRMLSIINYSYLGFLILLPVALNLAAERNTTLAFVLYLPMTLWLFPMAALLPLNLLFARRLALACVLVAAGYLWFGMDFQWHAWQQRPEGQLSLKIMTFNRGQEGRQSMRAFVEAEQPDLIALQDCAVRPIVFQRQYRMYPHGLNRGAFLLLSKYPLEDATLIEEDFYDRPMPVATRFVVNADGRRFAFYNVHLPTPRDALVSMRRGGFLLGLIGIPGTPLGEKRQTLDKYWQARVTLAEQLAEKIKADPLPVVVAGDFNTASRGVIYRTFSDFLTDSHKVRGRGYQFSFPGSTRNPFALFQPWLRLDYVFAGPGWTVLDSRTEPHRPSQHRAMAATLTLDEPK